MTVPTTGGRVVTLATGSSARPVMLTEYANGQGAALTIINMSTSRVWVAGDSAVASGAGVPLDALTSLPWTAGGQVWAVADVAATDPVQLVVTSAVGDWSPSPAAIGLQVAEQLSVQGVPNAIRETILHQLDFVAGADSMAPGEVREIDVSEFSQLALVAMARPDQAQGPILAALQVAFQSPSDVNYHTVDQMTVNGPALLAVPAGQLKLTNPSATLYVSFTLIGSNRQPLERMAQRQNAELLDNWTLPTTTMVAGTTYPLTHGTPNTFLQGPVFVRCALSAGTAARASLVATDAAGTQLYVIDGAELTAGASGTVATKLAALPAGYTLALRCTTAGSAAATVTLAASSI